MAKDQKVELLAAVPLFSACSDKELKRIASLATSLEAPEGDALTKEGSPGSEFFVIAEGRAKVTLRGDDVASLGPGDFFGEMSLLDGEPRAATVTAETPMRVFVIGAGEFGALLEEAPSVARRILRGLARRLREAEGAPTQ
jgi:CRP/FNR family transcriptional regulator, cyclic AMP receptor protein